MFLRQIKKISKEEADVLRNAYEKKKILNSIKDSSFLCKDLDEDTSNLVACGDKEEKIEVSKDIGTLTKLKYETYLSFYNLSYTESKWKEKIEDLRFVMEQPAGTSAYFNENIPCVGISILGTKKNKAIFFNGMYYEEKNSERLNAVPSNFNIFKLAAFFSRRKRLYKKIYEILLKNKEEFEKISNRFFVEDLIKLFSVTKRNKKAINFMIPLTNEKEQFAKKQMSERDGILLGKMLFHADNRPNKDENTLKYVSNIWLNRKNQLIIETMFICTDYKDAESGILEVGKDVEFMKFQKRINDWAGQTVSVINFGYDIYEKVKGKILLANT